MFRKYICHTAFVLSGLLLSACRDKLELRPETAIDSHDAVNGETNLTLATSGNYSLLNNFNYITAYYHLVESPADNTEATGIFNPGGTRDFEAYSYNHSPALSNPASVYTNAYKLLRGVNNVIVNVPDNAAAALMQLKGENLFMRALAHYTLVSLFGRPYIQQNGNNPGIVIADKPTPPLYRPEKRNTVKEVYDLMIADLLAARTLMTTARSETAYATRDAANAMLSALYLNMGAYAKSIQYANEVINSGKYELTRGTAFQQYFAGDHSAGEKETIFCLRQLDGTGSGFYYYNQSYTVEKFAAVSPPLLALLKEGKNDLRLGFYKVLTTTSGNTYTFTTKFIQNPAANPTAKVSSPPLFRLAGLYLDRAEANAKLGNHQAALDDINLIRQRAGLSGDDLYSLTNLHGRADVLSVVLDERRIELAFEFGHRREDLLRNNLPMIRTYGKQGIPGSNLTVQTNDKRVVYFLPQNETNGVTNDLQQNP
ncbi:RagB/SusD family nutrient uptake outer membrane protein [Chitinophaga pendula]|uniref:RagB/SusD family nutrient uptake outer membrane protein n=1 Tax=Chitinophaga TaxID=79328 RepID=UPI000BB026F6|nr:MULTISPECIES: RagB/SusD family nutrient uptake outer membrane protein [Chitinophaga]ASZ14123.1 hypothetical protein CK934_25830 [Chitinophaga sp. MD30]UCJ08241.1 RagB/SusD family nutrient uptake outer membrane protein [Chitinophaga pendula]